MSNPSPSRLPESPVSVQPVQGASASWLADCGDGSYRNPVLFADYSDPDVIRVGEDYWMTSSSFGHVPGLPILHSTDLVNWTLVNHALPRLVPEVHFREPRHGAGVWAPSLRYRAGKYILIYPDPDFGLYVLTANDPRGAWSSPVLIKEGRGLIDPCPLWDEDGQAWLVHGWAKSRSGICNRLTLHRMDPETCRILDDGVVVVDGDQMPGWKTIEGPKLYKRGGWYYIFAPAGGVAEGYQAVFRSRAIQGPYENRIVLAQGSTPVNGPHQGAWVETPGGEHWFFHFQEIPASGRVVHLQPMAWREDGWPMMGVKQDAQGTGEPVLRHAKPAANISAVAAPATSDDFRRTDLGRQWQWQANPSSGWYSIAEGAGVLRLHCVPQAGVNHWRTPNLLLQKFPAPVFAATCELDGSALGEGDTAGLMVFGYDYAWLGLQRVSGILQIVHARCVDSSKGTVDVVHFRQTLSAAVFRIHVRVQVAEGSVCVFSHSIDGRDWSALPQTFQAVSSKWVGAKVGLFASALPGGVAPGHVECRDFCVNGSAC